MPQPVLSTAQKGELALLRVLLRAAEKGWVASRPTRDCRYDLVLDDGERLFRVQVKYAGRRANHCQGAVSLDFTKGGKRDRTYLDHEIDALLAYVAPVDTLVWLSPQHFHHRRNVQLRYMPTLSGQKNGCLLVSDVAWKGRKGPGFRSRLPDQTVGHWPCQARVERHPWRVPAGWGVHWAGGPHGARAGRHGGRAEL